jgi:hypothetical protein
MKGEKKPQLWDSARCRYRHVIGLEMPPYSKGQQKSRARDKMLLKWVG